MGKKMKTRLIEAMKKGIPSGKGVAMNRELIDRVSRDVSKTLCTNVDILIRETVLSVCEKVCDPDDYEQSGCELCPLSVFQDIWNGRREKDDGND